MRIFDPSLAGAQHSRWGAFRSCDALVMQVYLFISDKASKVRAFTSDETGENLPADYAPWQALNSGRPTTIGSKTDPVSAAIAKDGFFLMSGSSQQAHGDGRSHLNKKSRRTNR
jgi:hypothetical protein